MLSKAVEYTRYLARRNPHPHETPSGIGTDRDDRIGGPAGHEIDPPVESIPFRVQTQYTVDSADKSEATGTHTENRGSEIATPAIDVQQRLAQSNPHGVQTLDTCAPVFGTHGYCQQRQPPFHTGPRQPTRGSTVTDVRAQTDDICLTRKELGDIDAISLNAARSSVLRDK
jgi:hypothetical protein